VSVNSLSNFGTPGLNGDRSMALQPIFANRFRTTFFNFGATNLPAPYDLTRQCYKVGRPNVQFEEVKLYNYVSTTYVANRGEWQTITITFYDDIANTVQVLLQNQVAKQMNFVNQTVSRAGENYKFEFDLDALAGGGSAGGAGDPNILQKWSYSGCWITETNLGEFNAKENSNIDLEITVRYDNVIGFDQNGNQMGTFSQTAEIAGQLGIHSTGIGQASTGIAISGTVASALSSISFSAAA
jgi:hypothetical protein